MLLLVSAASSGQRIQLDPVSLQLSSANEASEMPVNRTVL